MTLRASLPACSASMGTSLKQEPLPLLGDDPLQPPLAVAALLRPVLEQSADPVEPAGGSSMPRSPASRLKKASGIWVRIPAPSPVSGSLPLVPRCSRLRSTSSPSSTVSRVRRPSTRATNPSPQAS